MITASKHISIAIQCSPEKVYDFASNPENFPRWVTSFCLSARKVDGEWIIETTTGPIKLRFVEKNPYGVLDHFVTVSPDVKVYAPMRVIANGDGSELVFTLFQQPGMSDEQFAMDAGMVERDLRTLKRILEA
jgi:hypothetical protein